MSKPIRNLPLPELQKAANAALARFPGSEVFFKFTCWKCGARQTFDKPNLLFEYGNCEECGHTTKLKEGGFLLAFPGRKEST